MTSITPIQAIGISSALTTIYVGSMYLWEETRSSDFDRNTISAVKKRTLSGFLSCAVAAGAWQSLTKDGITVNPQGNTLDALGNGFVTVGLLFLGVATTKICRTLSGGFTTDGILPPSDEVDNPHLLLRNYVIAPASEEFVFRGALLNLLTTSSLSPTQATIVTCVLFSVAHYHHTIVAFQKKRLSVLGLLLNLFAGTLIHSAFTALSSVVYFQSGKNLFSPMLAHSLCNYLGPPIPSLTLELPRIPRLISVIAYVVGIVGFFRKVW
eukprot:PhF_6_TR13911/c0_g1_i1/m.22362/K08658/RCE1, FACE2; prenyl protein peptidase